MKLLRNSIMVLMLAALGTVWSCGGDDPSPLSIIERLSGTWTIAAASEGGSPATFDTAGFSITFNEDGSYTITPGSLPLEYKPNYASSGNSGSFALGSGNSQIIFDGNIAAAVSVSDLQPTDETKPLTSMTVSFQLDDKNNTSLSFDLVKQ